MSGKLVTKYPASDRREFTKYAYNKKYGVIPPTAIQTMHSFSYALL